MNVTLIGMGSGQPENLTLQGLAALRQADLILGARRLLAVLPAGCTENRAAAYRPDEVAELLQTSGAENAVLVYSGDTGFYSGASSMMEKLEALGVRARVLPGLSSIQLLAAALGRPWQGWNLVSAHGRTCDPVAECMQGRPTFFLTGGSEGPPPSAPSWRQRASGTCRASWASASARRKKSSSAAASKSWPQAASTA